jgi:hypothetical protein
MAQLDSLSLSGNPGLAGLTFVAGMDLRPMAPLLLNEHALSGSAQNLGHAPWALAPADRLPVIRSTATALLNSLLDPQQQEAFATDESGRPIPLADAFYSWIKRMTETADYRNTATRPALVHKLHQLVADLQSGSGVLRSSCFHMALEAMETCGDRVADAMNDMHVAIFNDTFNPATKTLEQMLALGRSFHALQLVDSHAFRYLNDLRQAGRPHREEVEVKMAFRVNLEEEFALPLRADNMLYQRCADLTITHYDAARQQVRAGLGDAKGAIAFLSDWAPLRRYAMQQCRDKINDAHEEFAQRQEALDDLVGEGALPEGEYNSSARKLMQAREEATVALVDEWLRQIIDDAVRPLTDAAISAAPA